MGVGVAGWGGQEGLHGKVTSELGPHSHVSPLRDEPSGSKDSKCKGPEV